MTITDDAVAIAGDARRSLARLALARLARPVWYALVAYGGMWLGGVEIGRDGRVVPLVPAGRDAVEPARQDLRAS